MSILFWTGVPGNADVPVYSGYDYTGLVVDPIDEFETDESVWYKLALTQAELDTATQSAPLDLGAKPHDQTISFWRRCTVLPGTPVQNYSQSVMWFLRRRESASVRYRSQCILHRRNGVPLIRCRSGCHRQPLQVQSVHWRHRSALPTDGCSVNRISVRHRRPRQRAS
jgi:hypothetical protein